MPNQISFKRFRYLINPRGLGDTELSNAPDGYLDTNITYTRSQKYAGLLRQFTLPLKFVKEGAYLLRREFYQYLLAANVTFTILKMNQQLGYDQLFQGIIDFSKSEDTLTYFSAPAVINDFSKYVDAYDSVQYAISLNDPAALNVELTPLVLSEIANLLPTGPPDGNIHSDYFPPIEVVNNQQNAINPSVRPVAYGQLRSPNFSTSQDWFFNCQLTGKLLMTGNLAITISTDSRPHHLRLCIFNQAGTIVHTFYDAITSSASVTMQVAINKALSVNKNDKLFLYMQQVDAESGNTGITIEGGQIDLSYKTISSPSMCQGMRLSDVFGKLLQAMHNTNDFAPNLPVPYRSNLLGDLLGDVVMTSSDSIRAATGSLFYAGDSLFAGSYKVLGGTVHYGDGVFTTGDLFSFDGGVLFFTSTDGGVAQKVQSIFIGNVYNIGDTLQPGGTFLVGGDTGQSAVYNGVSYPIGQSFTYILGQNTFSGSNDTVYVKQTAINPQIIISFADFFQSILSLMGGNAAFGVENGIAYLEDLSYVYRSGINRVSLGVVDKAIKFEPANDLLCNTIKVGYADQQYDAINGFQEVNSTQTYQTVLFAPRKELNLISPVRADCYGIETIRITQDDTSASRSDNDSFFIWLDGNPIISAGVIYFKPLGTYGALSITGVDPSYYNWKLSPKQNLLRGGAYLSSIFYNMKGYQIRLASALKNSAMVTVDLLGIRVAESDPINIADLPDPLFTPIYASFEAGLPHDIVTQLDLVPYGDLNFTTQGVTLKAFINNFSVQVGNEKPQTIKLLLSPKNDLTKLIRTRDFG